MSAAGAHQARVWTRIYAVAERDTPALPPAIAPASDNRAGCDARAAWQRWHVTPAIPWRNEAACLWHGVLERARVDVLAAQDLPGMACNLQQMDDTAPPQWAHGQLYRAARALFVGKPWDGAVLPPVSGKRAERLLQRLRLMCSGHPATDTFNDEAARQLLRSAAEVLDDAARFADRIRPLVLWLAGQKPAMGPASHESRRSETGRTGTVGEAVEQADAGADAPAAAGDAARASPFTGGYAAYSTRWDEELPAERYLTHLAPLTVDGPERSRVARLARQLQRRLQVARHRSWAFEREDGQLDPRRLTRLLTPGQGQAVFRSELAAPVAEACVVLLVDQSGSMHGERRRMAALAIDLAVQVLEGCRIKVEVLGYTTVAATDNEVQRLWQAHGRPASPGRLNAVRHIVYKTTQQPWRRARAGLALLLQDGFGQENIDGEALDWAARRLAQRPEAHKLLLVLGDGAPWDEATAAANGSEYLVAHLRHVIHAIEASPIHLAAIGTGQEVGRFYRHAVTLRRPAEVADVLFAQLGRLLGTDHAGNIR